MLKIKEPNIICNYCNKHFYKKPSKIGKEHNFCSIECNKSYNIENNFKNIKRICERCNVEYFPTYKVQQYCSRSCSMYIRGAEKTELRTYSTKCSWCDKEITKRLSQKGKTGDFCSPKCSEAFKRGNEEKIITKICKRCNKEFTCLYRRQFDHCSRKCSSLFQPGGNHYGYGKVGPTKGLRPWTYGKTAKTDERLAALGKKISIKLKIQFKTNLRSNAGINNPNYGKTVLDRTPEQLNNYSIGTWKRYNSPSSSGFGFLKGYYLSKKTNKNMRFRSSFERKMMICLDNDPTVLSYDYEPFGLIYKDSKRYYPDFLINFYNLTRKMIEIKGWVSDKETFELKNKAAQEYCVNNNIKFEIWNKKELEEYCILYYDKISEEVSDE